LNRVVDPSLESPSPGALLALLIDSDGDSRAMYAEFLRWRSYRIEETADSEDGFAKAVAFQPDVIVTGVRLKPIDGYALCARLRADPATAATPIIVLTSDAFDHQVRRAELAGATLVLTERCLPDTLRREIERLLQGSSRTRD
jgi:twitching motility two-component system response regulator PilG